MEGSLQINTTSAIIKGELTKTKKLKQKSKMVKKSDIAFARLFKKPAYRIGAIASVLLLLAGSTSIVVRADSCSTLSECSSKISQLNAKNEQAQNSINGLQAEANDYEDAINKLQSQIASLQSAIADNQQKQADLNRQIEAYQKKIDDQKQILGEDIRTMYVDGPMSNIEMLASSNSLSTYVDKQEYRNAVSDKIQDSLNQIANLQNQVKQNKIKIDQMILAQQNQEAQLAADRAQQKEMLSYNQSQQTAFNQEIASNKAKIQSLQKQQYQINYELYGSDAVYGGTGSYPYASATQVAGEYNWVYDGSLYDPLGWNYRNCTSYAFWRLYQTRGIGLHWYNFPTVYNSGGKIGTSIGDFRNLGYTVDHNPAGASLAVWGVGQYGAGYGGTYGHIMYVESSTSDSAYVSQYNVFGEGKYSTMTISPTSYTWFVHIP